MRIFFYKYVVCPRSVVKFLTDDILYSTICPGSSDPFLCLKIEHRERENKKKVILGMFVQEDFFLY